MAPQRPLPGEVRHARRVLPRLAVRALDVGRPGTLDVAHEFAAVLAFHDEEAQARPTGPRGQGQARQPLRQPSTVDEHVADLVHQDHRLRDQVHRLMFKIPQPQRGMGNPPACRGFLQWLPDETPENRVTAVDFLLEPECPECARAARGRCPWLTAGPRRHLRLSAAARLRAGEPASSRSVLDARGVGARGGRGQRAAEILLLPGTGDAAEWRRVRVSSHWTISGVFLAQSR